MNKLLICPDINTCHSTTCFHRHIHKISDTCDHAGEGCGRVCLCVGEQKLVDEHVEYTVGLFVRTYREAFKHGYKHGLEDGKK